MKLTKNYIRSLIKEELTEAVDVPTKAKDTLTYLAKIVDSANFKAFWGAALPKLLRPPAGVTPATIKAIMVNAWPKGGSSAFNALMGEDTEAAADDGGGSDTTTTAVTDTVTDTEGPYDTGN